MARGHPGLPALTNLTIAKRSLLQQLEAVDGDAVARERILILETEFRRRIDDSFSRLPRRDAKFAKFKTNPFVLMFYCMQHSYSHICEIEEAILPAKLFSSMETSAGKMVEAVALPIYAWEIVESEMHTPNSALDGKRLEGDVLKLATLKSGPSCLNDEMVENFADAILTNCGAWSRADNVQRIDFTYGVLYGTKRQSNKKDWHILRNIHEKLEASGDGRVTVEPTGRWNCQFTAEGLTVDVTVRVGKEWWDYLHETAFIELCAALIRACVTPSDTDPEDYEYTIADLAEIISLDCLSPNYNVGILQRSQLEWLFFFARHFCDELVDEDLTDIG